MRNECSIIVTHRCNNTCAYCDVPLRQAGAADCSFKSIRDATEMIERKFERIAISGGEPGLIQASKVSALLDINAWTQVNTNGMFVAAGLWEEFRSRIDKLHYHCVQELTDEIEYVTDDPKVEYTFVLHSKNAHMVDGFLSRNKGLSFHVKPFAMKGGDDLSLSPDDVRLAIDACEANENECTNLKKFLLGLEAPTAAQEFLRDNCCARTPAIDLVTWQAKACTTKDVWSIELTEGSIDMAKRKGKGGARCKDCNMPLRHTSVRDILDAIKHANRGQ